MDIQEKDKTDSDSVNQGSNPCLPASNKIRGLLYGNAPFLFLSGRTMAEAVNIFGWWPNLNVLIWPLSQIEACLFWIVGWRAGGGDYGKPKVFGLIVLLSFPKISGGGSSA